MHFQFLDKETKGIGYERRMEGPFPLSRMAEGGRVFGEEEKGLPSMPFPIGIHGNGHVFQAF